jgi:hypothetical protein
MYAVLLNDVGVVYLDNTGFRRNDKGSTNAEDHQKDASMGVISVLARPYLCAWLTSVPKVDNQPGGRPV